MNGGKVEDVAGDHVPRWEYKVIRVFVGPTAYQKHGPETPGS